MIITPEMKAKAESTKTLEELEALAREAGLSLSAKELANAFAQTHPKTGVLEDDELDNVVGGCGSNEPAPPSCAWCGKTGVKLISVFLPVDNYGTFEDTDLCEECYAKCFS